MNPYSSLTRYELQNKLNPQEVKGVQIITGAMAGGVIMLFLVIMFLFSGNVETSKDLYNDSNGTFMDLLLMVLMAVCIGAYCVVFILPKIQLNTERLKSRLEGNMVDTKGMEINDPVAKILAIYRGLMIIRLALLEGTSLLGLVILFIAIQNGSLYVRPAIWVVLIPGAIFLLYVVATFPTKERLVNYIDNKILQKLRNS